MPTNLWLLLEPALKAHPENPAWICRERDGNRVVSYRQIHDAALTTASRLRQRGVLEGETVGITAPNGPEFVVAALASWKIGANIAPIHIGNSDADIESQIEAVSPKVMMLHETDLQHESGTPILLEGDSERIREESRVATDPDPDKLAMRIYTSGSTGHPKVVRLSHGNPASNVMAVRLLQQFDEKDRFISLLPFSHALGLTANLLLPMYHGASLVAPRILAASEILKCLEEENVTVVVAVPRLFRSVMLGLEKKFQQGGKGLSLYRALLKKTPLSLRQHLNAPIRKKLGGRIKVWVSGGSHLDGQITHYYHELGLPLRQGYGLTETSPLISVQDQFDPAVDSVGKPVDQVEVKINDPDEHGSGELWVRGPNVMLGYEDEAQTRDVMAGDWFRTGDIARLDEEGRIYLTGRSKRLIVTEAGKNVYPEELETLLERDPAIKEAGVFELDMKPVCVLAMDSTDGAGAARQSLHAFNQRTSAHNHISRFAVVDELPRTPLGKMALQQLPVVFAQHEVT